MYSINKQIKILFLILFPIFLFSSDINIAVASNTFFVTKKLKEQFLKIHPKTTINIVASSSGKLTAQIKNNAPYHIFMSADMKYPNDLYKNSLAITKPKIYAKGTLVILSQKNINMQKGIYAIKEAKKIALANPKTAPYGKATLQAIKNAKLYQISKSKFIYTQSISQVVFYTKVTADIGFVALSSLFNKNMRYLKENKNWTRINPKLYTPINQGIVLLSKSKKNNLAKEFYSFILSPKAKKIFSEFGYMQ